MTVADKIGDEYKKWENYNKVFISAPTGTGKTYFVLNVLLPYACSQNKRILFLVNRKILKEQMEKDISILPFEQQGNIQIETYQTLERKMSEIYVDQRDGQVKASGYEALKRYRQYDYVVCDECHYFLADSNYNTNTELSFRWVQDMFSTKIRIFMSATIDEIKKYINDDDRNSENERTKFYNIKSRTCSKKSIVPQRKCVYEYCLERNYDYVDVHVVEKRDEIANVVLGGKGKWLIFVDSISYGKELRKKLNEEIIKRGETKSVVMITSEYHLEQECAEEVTTIANESKFSANILISTSVLDNGINIKDLELRNIVLMADTEDEFIQMLGRKRKDERTTHLYIVKMDKNHFKNRQFAIEGARNIGVNYWEKFYNIRCWAQNENIDKEMIDMMEAREIFIQHCLMMNRIANNKLKYDDVKEIFRVEAGCFVMSLLAIKHLEYLNDSYRKAIEGIEQNGEDSFLKEQLRWLGKSDIEADELIANLKISQLDKDRKKVIGTMEQMVDKSMDKKTMGEFKVTIKTELINLLKETVCTEDDKEALIKDLGKKDRPLSGPQFEILNKHYGIPYGPEVEGGKYTIKKV